MTLSEFCLKCCKIKGVKTKTLGIPYLMIGKINVTICLLLSVFSRAACRKQGYYILLLKTGMLCSRGPWSSQGAMGWFSWTCFPFLWLFKKVRLYIRVRKTFMLECLSSQ